MTFWNEIYNHFDPVAFSLFGFNVHWYGIMYVLALLTALGAAKYFVKKDNIPISDALLDNYFFWVEIGVILGARIGYLAIYSGEFGYYLTHPWQIFNPFYNGEFIGIRGMSYHGAVVGFLAATWLFCSRYPAPNQVKISNLKNKSNSKFVSQSPQKEGVGVWVLLDLCALCIPLGYIFGRIGNFLNQELVGRVTEVSWAIDVAGELRHPSQLYEAFLEGLIIFLILFFYRKFKKFDGELICLYAMLYTLARFICEFYREPDAGIGFIFLNLSMGQILSFTMFLIGVIVYFTLRKNYFK